jgi:ABC-type polar amino acid transport system ATPase subunit
MLVGKEIRKSFKNREVLHAVDISVTPGKITVLIGPSGSGKTTLVKALSLLDCPQSGAIIVDNETYTFPSTNVTTKAPWPKLTVVFQQHFLWPHLTLRENILLPLHKNHPGLSSLRELIQVFGMEEFIDRYPNQVSMGQRQRAALARAFVLNPKYILLDEITSALDVEQASIVLSHLLELRKRGIGILIVTHHLAFARNLIERDEGDQVAFLEEGRILSSGGKAFFQEQKNERIARFLSAFEIASF